MEDEWDKLGLTLLSSNDDNDIVLFSSTGELEAFFERLDAYDGEIPPGQKGRRHSGFVNRIVDVGVVQPSDRIGSRFKEWGVSVAEYFEDEVLYIVDIEFWDFGSQPIRTAKAEEVAAFIEELGGEVYDLYVGPSITILRVSAPGRAIRPVLSIPEVAFVDLPPEPDLEQVDINELVLENVPGPLALDPDLPVVAVMDSGVNAHPLIEDAIVAHEAFPVELGIADVFGHGTRVAGAALLGDIQGQLEEQEIRRVGRLVSIKVVTDEGRFYERRTLPTQMRSAIEKVHQEHSCRIFVISLGDTQARLPSGRVGPWAATLDELARELDILIFVSAGNRSPRGGMRVEEAVTEYPRYLLEDNNRICEPAGAANVVTVGSVAHSNGLDPRHARDAHVHPITDAMEPSPFTRTGPGGGGVIKPDFVDIGGTMIYDAGIASLRTAPDIPAAGIVSLNHDFLRQYLTTFKGTSAAAPLLAHKAAQLLRRLPGASANLIRALLAISSEIPEPSAEKLASFDDEDKLRICGNGFVDPLRAAYSEDHRVILYDQASLGFDQFAVYRIPIPDEFKSNGKRTIRVALAFDPSVRRSRAEYVGSKMNFRLIRGCPSEIVFDHFRSHAGEDGEHAEIPKKFDCKLKPGPQLRDGNTLQVAEVSFSKDTANYGDDYYLVVRCLSGWASVGEEDQNYAVVVEMKHQPEIQLFARLQQRVRV